MRYKIYLHAFLLTIGLLANGQAQTVAKSSGTIFPKGNRAPASNFTGVVWMHPLVVDDPIYNCVMGSVTFEPGARSNWHCHNSGQILLVTEGEGYYQEKGKPIEIMHKGDVIKCPPNVEHWHGASPNNSCTHIAIVPNTEKGIVKWLQPVTDPDYNNYNK